MVKPRDRVVEYAEEVHWAPRAGMGSTLPKHFLDLNGQFNSFLLGDGQTENIGTRATTVSKSFKVNSRRKGVCSSIQAHQLWNQLLLLNNVIYDIQKSMNAERNYTILITAQIVSVSKIRSPARGAELSTYDRYPALCLVKRCDISTTTVRTTEGPQDTSWQGLMQK